MKMLVSLLATEMLRVCAVHGFDDGVVAGGGDVFIVPVSFILPCKDGHADTHE